MSEDQSLRSDVQSWSCEDGDMYQHNKHIGLTGSPDQFYFFKTVLEAIANGWTLLGPPTEIETNGHSMYVWWLVRNTWRNI